MNELLQNLNSEQKDAVLATEGPVLVLAGAGSGKTKALTHRIAYLIKDKKVSPYNILAVTFTNKAAKEMEQRIAHLLNDKEQGTGDSDLATSYSLPTTPEAIKLPWMGTFHSVCVKILRRESHHLGFSSSFSIYDENDKLSVIKRLMKELQIDPKHFNPNSISYFISGAKNELINATEYKKYLNSPFEKMTARVYERYEVYLKEANSMDFDDLIMQTVFLFQQNSEVLLKYQNLYKYILVDEYQDTNQAQYLLTKMLADKHKNIMVVGDDYQSIYSWRGANFRNILNFERDYKDAKVVKLEQNYRSTKKILQAANDVIKYNENKTDKKLWTVNSDGSPITVYEALNEKDEAEFVAMEIKSAVSRGRFNYSNCAVLYRTNAQSRAVEEAFMRFNIPYRVVGGLRFYERKEIKDIIAYLKLINNPNDFEALSRAVSAPSRGIGEKTLGSIFGTSFLEENASLPKKVQDFYDLLKEIQGSMQSITLDQLILNIAIKSGYKKFLLDGTPEGEGRWENIEELVTVAEQIQKNYDSVEREEDQTALDMFLQQVALVQDSDQINQEEGVVTLMTLHSAKGLEFDNVFIVGVEEGIFPHSRALMDMSEMEEERRLCYVGITRAKQCLYLIHAQERNIYGRFQANEKSRFIENISVELLDQI